MKLDDQAAEIAFKASRMIQFERPTIEEALELVRQLAEIVVVLAVRHEVDPL